MFLFWSGADVDWTVVSGKHPGMTEGKRALPGDEIGADGENCGQELLDKALLLVLRQAWPVASHKILEVDCGGLCGRDGKENKTKRGKDRI